MSVAPEPVRTYTTREKLICSGVYLFAFLVYLFAMVVSLSSSAAETLNENLLIVLYLVFGAIVPVFGVVLINEIRDGLPKYRRTWEAFGILGLVLAPLAYIAWCVFLFTADGEVPINVGGAFLPL